MKTVKLKPLVNEKLEIILRLGGLDNIKYAPVRWVRIGCKGRSIPRVRNSTALTY